MNDIKSIGLQKQPYEKTVPKEQNKCVGQSMSFFKKKKKILFIFRERRREGEREEEKH